jgi:hypothetical protein
VSCLTTFARLVVANILHRLPIDRLRDTAPPIPDEEERLIQGILL